MNLLAMDVVDERTLKELEREDKKARREARERNLKDNEYFDPEEDQEALRYLNKKNKKRRR